MLSKGGIKMKAFLLELHRHQIVFSFLLRYMPIPMGVQTCLLSISPVPLWKIIITSFVALLTKIIPLVYIGTTGIIISLLPEKLFVLTKLIPL